MKYIDLDYQNIQDKLSLDVKTIIYKAMDLYYAIIDKFIGINPDKVVVLSLYLSILKNNKNIKAIMKQNDITYEYISKAIKIDELEVKSLDEKIYKRIYDYYFKNIIYNIFFMTYNEYNDIQLSNFKAESIFFHLHDKKIVGNDTVNDILMMVYNNEYCFLTSKNFALHANESLYNWQHQSIYNKDNMKDHPKTKRYSNMLKNIFQNNNNDNNKRGKVLNLNQKK